MKPVIRDIVEVIDDNADGVGHGAANKAAHDTGGRRRVGTVAIGTLVAVIGYGVATSASSSDPPRAAPDTSSSIVAQPAPSTTTAEPNIPFYAADPPPAFTVQYANLQQLANAPIQGYAYELWATKGASANSGSWFSVKTYRGASALSTPNAYRVQTARSTVAISHIKGGQTLIQFSVGGFGVSVMSFGWTDDDLVRLAGSVQTDGRTVDFTDSWFTADHELITSVQPWLAAQSIPAEQVSYASSDDPATAIVITVGKRMQGFEGGAAIDRQLALQFLLEDYTSFDVNGLPAVAGWIVGQIDYAMATWIDGDNVITVTSAMPVPEVIDIARGVHQVSYIEWDGMKFQALGINGPRSAIVPSEVPSISSGTDSASRPWTIGVTMSFIGRQQQVNWRWEGSGFGSDAKQTAHISTVVDNERTYVLADLPRTIATTAHLEISRSGLDPVVVPFNDASTSMDRTFAAYAFSEATTYSAQIVGGDGAVLAVWPSA